MGRECKTSEQKKEDNLQSGLRPKPLALIYYNRVLLSDFTIDTKMCAARASQMVMLILCEGVIKCVETS